MASAGMKESYKCDCNLCRKNVLHFSSSYGNPPWYFVFNGLPVLPHTHPALSPLSHLKLDLVTTAVARIGHQLAAMLPNWMHMPFDDQTLLGKSKLYQEDKKCSFKTIEKINWVKTQKLHGAFEAPLSRSQANLPEKQTFLSSRQSCCLVAVLVRPILTIRPSS